MYIYRAGERLFEVSASSSFSVSLSPSHSHSPVSFLVPCSSSRIVALGTATSQKVITIMNVYFRNQLNRGR